jgi:protein TonB
MIPILLLASIPSMLWSAEGSANNAADQMVRDEKNGQFIWKFYPPGALKRGEQGRVGFKLTIEPTGTVSNCAVTESSGFKTLDAETCEIMGLYAQVKPVRNSEGRAIRAEQGGFIVWKLPPGSVQIASASTSKTMPKPDDMICRKDVTTGSLIASTKVCMKRSEWNRNSEDQRSRWGDLQGRGYTNGDAVTMAPGQ